MKSQVEIQQIDRAKIQYYAEIPISFEVNTVFEVRPLNAGLGGVELLEVGCSPYFKDYDMLEDSHPSSWAKQFDIDSWGLFTATYDGAHVGSAAVASPFPNWHKDMPILWDLRVHPDFRGQGIGLRLLEAVTCWARSKAYRTLMVETQNINAPACKFYARHGFTLGTIDVHGYPNSLVQDETKLLWYLNLPRS